MQFEPDYFKFQSNGIFIIMETFENTSKPIYAFWSHEKAKNYINPNRKIIGPIPFIDGFIPEFNHNFIPPKLPKSPRFDPIFPQ